MTDQQSVPYIDIECVRKGGRQSALNTFYHRHKTDPDVIVRKRAKINGRWRYRWLMGKASE